MSEETTEFEPVIRRRRRISSVWLVPVVAVILAGWLVWKNAADRGPLVTISFNTAEGIAVGKTEIRCRSVTIGTVEAVTLTDDLKAEVDVRIRPAYEDLLRTDTRFWVVRPRVSTSNVSGLGTLITGAYIELDPGNKPKRAARYNGLEEPPVTANDVPGLRLTLVADDAGSLAVGSPIYHLGIEVGKVERRTLDLNARKVVFSIFIREKYARLVRQSTRFWNTSGFDVTAGSEGFKFRTPSVQALVTGGAVFSTPIDFLDAPQAEDGGTFTLYEDESAADAADFTPDRRLLLYFEESVRGLEEGASVEYRGIAIGRVVDISFKYSPPGDQRVPVLIELDTGALRRPSADGGEPDIDLAGSVEKGLRARLSSASLLTGAQFIDLDFHPNAEPAELAHYESYDVVPTVPGEFTQIGDKVNVILAKLEAMPLEETLTKFGTAADETATTLADLRQTLAEAEKLLASESTQAIPGELNETLAELRTSIESLGPDGSVQGDLRRTLDELRSALRSFDALTNTIDEKPNSLLFGRESSGDPIPRARR